MDGSSIARTSACFRRQEERNWFPSKIAAVLLQEIIEMGIF